MCHCSTSEDVELGLLRFSLCLPGAGGIPKPRTPGDQQVAWLVNPASLDADPSTPEDSGWICGMYARAWARLEMAIYGQDVEDSQEIAFCYGDAVTFAACLPCMSPRRRVNTSPAIANNVYLQSMVLPLDHCNMLSAATLGLKEPGDKISATAAAFHATQF